MAKKPTKGAFKAKALLIDMQPTTYNTRFRANALYDVRDKINRDGLPVLLVHDSGKLPVGAWYSAEVESDVLFTKFFVPKEIAEYEDIKTRVEADILDSVSIGFNAGVHDCSICGNDIQDYENCSHIPGRKYEIKDPVDGSALGEETCYVMLDDVKASEASLVYSGAVPAAKIIESSNKAEYFSQNKLNFAEGSLEVVHAGKFVQDNIEHKNEGEEMKEEFEALQTKHQELTDKYTTSREDVITSREDVITYREKNLEMADKVAKYDEAVQAHIEATADVVAAKAETVALRATFAEKIVALAVPFKADYEAPEDDAALLADFDKYLEEAKALPSGQQTVTDEEPVYSEADSTYKV